MRKIQHVPTELLKKIRIFDLINKKRVNLSLKDQFINLKAASILRVASIKNWINRSYAETYLQKGLDFLKSVCIQFLYKIEATAPNAE